MLPKLHSRCQGLGNKTQLDSFVVTSASSTLSLCFTSSVIRKPLKGRRNGIQNFSPGVGVGGIIFEFAQYTPSLVNPYLVCPGLGEKTVSLLRDGCSETTERQEAWDWCASSATGPRPRSGCGTPNWPLILLGPKSSQRTTPRTNNSMGNCICFLWGSPVFRNFSLFGRRHSMSLLHLQISIFIPTYY